MSKIVLFGDSIFAGYRNGWTSAICTNKLQEKLPKDTIVNNSIPGATTSDALGWLDNLVLAEKPDIVVLFYGANDISITNYITPAIYQAQLQEMIDRIGQDKLVLVTPPYSDSHQLGDRSPDLIEQYVVTAQHTAEKNGIPAVPLYEIMCQQKDPNQLLQPDGIHFTSSAYDLLAQGLVLGIETLRHNRQ